VCEGKTPFLPSPVKEKGVKTSHASRCIRVSYRRMVKRWRQKTKNSGRARYACALGCDWGLLIGALSKRSAGSWRIIPNVGWTRGSPYNWKL